ncbi:MAG: hypothetical protein QNK37_11240 [Acidobacteriota bacterium]|nr:hypothetical protein [Acidobacteriota bacterium]
MKVPVSALFILTLTAPLWAQMRMIPHVTRVGAGFSSTVTLENADVAQQDYTLTPYNSSGQALAPARGSLGNTETRSFSIEELFPGLEDVSHIVIEGDIHATIAYAAIAGEGSPAHVPESQEVSPRFRLFPGNWNRVFDGIAVVNTGNADADVWVTQREFTTAREIKTVKAMTLAPMAKDLFVIGGPGFDNFEDTPDTFYEIHADQELAITALRGSLPGSEFLWVNQATRWEPAVVKVNNDNPTATAFTDPFSLGPDAPDINNMPQGEVWIDVAPDGRLVACAKDYRYGPTDDTTYNARVWNGIYFSRDGGNTWQNRMFLDTDPNQGLEAVTLDSFGQAAGTEIRFDHMSDPVVATDRDGNIYTTGLPYEARPEAPNLFYEPSAITMARRDPDGNLVASTVHFAGLEDDDTLFNDKNWIACSQDTPTDETIVVLAWRLFTSGTEEQPEPTRQFGGYVAVSGDGSATMAEPIRLPLTTNQVARTQFYQPLVGRDPRTGNRTLYVLFRNFRDDGSGQNSFLELDLLKADIEGLQGTQALYDHLSRDENWTYLPTRLTGNYWWGQNGWNNNSFRYSSFFMPALDHDTGYLYLASHFYDLTTGGSRVIVSRSTDAGESWEGPVEVDYPGTGYQFMPAIAVAGGRVSVLWYDSRHADGFTGNAHPTGVDVYYAEMDTALGHIRTIRLTTETQYAQHPVFTRDDGQPKRKPWSVEAPHELDWKPGPFIFEDRTKAPADCDGYGFIGDYIGLAADGESAYAVWADMRDLNLESDICSGNDIAGRRNQNVYFARIKKP